MPKKILHLCPFALNGGTEKDCYYYAKFNQENIHDIWVLGEAGPMSKAFSEAGNVKHLNILNQGLFQFKKNLKKELKGIEYDAILYWSSIHLPLVRAALKKQKAKLAVHIGNPIEQSTKVLIKNKVLAMLFPSSIPTCLFACSQYVQQSIANDAYLNQFENRFAHNPVDPLEKNPYNFKELNKNDAINMGMVARLDPIKDHKTLIKAIPKILISYPNLTLNIVGDGSLRKDLERQVKDLNLDKYVVFHGNTNKVYGFLNTWDLFVYSTTLKEGLGNVVIEALCNGLPVVISDLPMMQEITDGEEAGILFEAGDPEDLAQKVIRLLESNTKRKELSEKAFQRFQNNFHPNIYIQKREAFLFSTP